MGSAETKAANRVAPPRQDQRLLPEWPPTVTRRSALTLLGHNERKDPTAQQVAVTEVHEAG